MEPPAIIRRWRAVSPLGATAWDMGASLLCEGSVGITLDVT